MSYMADETVEIRSVGPPLGHMAILSYLIGMRTMTYFKIIQEIRGAKPQLQQEECMRANDIQLVSIGEGEKRGERS